MAESLTPCLCGADDVTLGPSTKRPEAREALASQADSLAHETPSGPTLRALDRTKLGLQVLSSDDYEVSCGTCGRWVHADSEVQAANLWNRAIAKLDHLQACCRDSSERRTDFDGMVLAVCTSPEHDTSLNGARWLPLEPSESYELKPTDAEAPR